MAALGAELGDDFVEGLARAFLNGLPQHRERLMDARQRGDVATLNRVAHTLLGEAGNLGLGEVVSACVALQRAADGDHEAPAAALLDGLASSELAILALIDKDSSPCSLLLDEIEVAAEGLLEAPYAEQGEGEAHSDDAEEAVVAKACLHRHRVLARANDPSQRHGRPRLWRGW